MSTQRNPNTVATAVILAAGRGRRLWPFAEVRPKTLVPVGNVPLLLRLVEGLRAAGVSRILVAAHHLAAQVRHAARGLPGVEVIDVGPTEGTPQSLTAALSGRSEADEQPVLVLHGDCLIDGQDLRRLASAPDPAALVAPLAPERPGDWICCTVREGRVDRIKGHPRETMTHRFAGFLMDRRLLERTASDPGVFEPVEVGMMPPPEGFLERGIAETVGSGIAVTAVETRGAFVDVDKPWHILEANRIAAAELCGALETNQLLEGATIDPDARVGAPVRLGRGSTIGAGVVVQGPLWVGDGVTIENGAILRGSNVIGDGSVIRDGCLVEAKSVVGAGCVVGHGAELSGVLMDGVYLYHYMEIAGVVGSHCDFGAGTVCGTLRFDDGVSTHVVDGRREVPPYHGNVSYLGDYCRTGVNTVLMPGCKVGVYSVVGPGVVLNEDLLNRTAVFVEQSLVRKPWGPERYGW